MASNISVLRQLELDVHLNLCLNECYIDTHQVGFHNLAVTGIINLSNSRGPVMRPVISKSFNLRGYWRVATGNWQGIKRVHTGYWIVLNILLALIIYDPSTPGLIPKVINGAHPYTHPPLNKTFNS